MGLNAAPKVEEVATITTAGAANKPNIDFSKRSKLTFGFQECVRKVKELCYPVEATTSRYYHHFRRWKNSKHNYKLVESLPPTGKEIVITPEKREEKEREYENDLQRMISLGKIKHKDPEQYKIGCMMLKWYFESKNKTKTDLRGNNSEMENLEFDEQLSSSATVRQKQQQNDKVYTRRPAFKPALAMTETKASNDSLKLSIIKDGPIPRQSKFKPLEKKHHYPQGPIELEIENDKSTANEKILKDLVLMIDDYLGDTSPH